MRILASIAALTGALIAAPRAGRAEDSSAAGWLGVGAFGARLATTVDVGLDVCADSYAVGIGARLRYLAGEGVRGEDWDDPSELLGVMRYAVYHRALNGDDGEETVRLAAAAGAIGDVRLGHGAVVDGFATGVDVDHGRVGAQLRADGGLFGVEGLVDDLTAPRLVAARAQWVEGDRLGVGFSAIGDLSAPSAPPASHGPGGGRAEVLPILVADGEYLRRSATGRLSGRIYADIVGVLGVAAGAHLGGEAAAELGASRARASARGELRLGSDGYIASWIGPLYELTRDGRLAMARAGGLAGLGALGELRLEMPGIGGGSVSYSRRPGIADIATARIAVPHFRGMQAALWAAAEVGGAGDEAGAMAAEVRARLPSRMFVVMEAARLYRRDEGAPVPLWIATAAVGGVIGE